MEYRIEKDTMGEVKVPAHVYWGAQTQRSIQNFPIAQDINKMPKEIIKAFAYLKKAAAITNYEAGILPQEKSDLIGKVCDEILTGRLDCKVASWLTKPSFYTRTTMSTSRSHRTTPTLPRCTLLPTKSWWM
jgi:fumarate hydratase class II